MNTIIDTIPYALKEYVEETILPQYKEFDKAHQLDHAVKVISESLELAQYFTVDIKMVYVIAAYHDLGLCVGREFHHIESGRILMEDSQLKCWFTEDELLIMRDAIEDHRASNKHEPRTLYGKIVAEADRIINPSITLRRTVQYGLYHYPMSSREQHYERFCEHLKEKYAEGGYLKLWISQSSNGSSLNELRALIADPVRLRILFDELYETEVISEHKA